MRHDPKDPRLAVAHPVKLLVLKHLAEHGKASPRDIAKASEVTLGTVSYHVRELADAKLIKLVGRKQVRGAIKHLYEIQPAALEAVRAYRELIDGALSALGADRA